MKNKTRDHQQLLEVNTLWKGCKIQNREFTLLPGIYEDVFCGYKGTKFFDISYNTSNAKQSIIENLNDNNSTNKL